MKIVFHPTPPEVDVAASAAEYRALSELLRSGHGYQSAELASADAFGRIALSRVDVSAVPTGRVRITVEPSRAALIITGDFASLAMLAANLDALATDEEGGHLHIDYFPGHAYLDPTSTPIIVNSPHGGMPRP
jgi:hypothetical protein